MCILKIVLTYTVIEIGLIPFNDIELQLAHAEQLGPGGLPITPTYEAKLR